MNKNPIIPFVLIMVLGVAAMFLMSFKGLGDMEEIAAQEENGGTEQAGESASATPEELYTQRGCVACHGADFNGGGAFPSLLGVGDRKSHEEIVDILLNGVPGTAMPGEFPEDKVEEMAEWLSTLK